MSRYVNQPTKIEAGGQYDNQFRVGRPDSLADLDWLAYGETRRTSDDPMSGNTAQSDKVLDSSYNLVQPGMDLQSWKEQQRHHARKRVLGLQALLALAHLGAPQPVHGTDLIDLDRAMDRVDYNLDRLSRQAADAFTLTHPGHGGMYVPADCPLVVALDPRHNHRRVTVIHAGYRGLAANIVGRTLGQVPFTAHETRVYVAPHAYEGFELSGEALDSPVTRDH